MGCIRLENLFRDRSYTDFPDIPDYDTFCFVSEGRRLYGEIMWPDGSFSSGRPCVLLFHGFPGSARNDDLAHALCRAGCVVITPHHRGAWGSEGEYLPSNCVQDAVNLAEYVRSPKFSQTYRIDHDAIFLAGHSMGGNTVLHAGKGLPWVRGMLLLAPYDPTLYLRTGRPDKLRKLLRQCQPLRCAGPEAIYQDLAAHREAYSFEGAFEAVRERNLLFAVGTRDTCAPPEEMVRPLWEKLEAHGSAAVQRLFSWPVGHGLLGCRMELIEAAAEFIRDALAR